MEALQRANDALRARVAAAGRETEVSAAVLALARSEAREVSAAVLALARSEAREVRAELDRLGASSGEAERACYARQGAAARRSEAAGLDAAESEDSEPPIVLRNTPGLLLTHSGEDVSFRDRAVMRAAGSTAASAGSPAPAADQAHAPWGA